MVSGDMSSKACCPMGTAEGHRAIAGPCFMTMSMGKCTLKLFKKKTMLKDTRKTEKAF